MTKKEMSNEFDILYNQVNSNTAPGIDQFEKSVFLTKGQDDIVKSFFDPRKNKIQSGFDVNDYGQLRQYNFSSLITNTELSSINIDTYDPRALAYLQPEDLFLVLNESITEESEGVDYIYQIIPIKFDDYTRLMQKPYQYPPKRSVWMLITNQGTIVQQNNIASETEQSSVRPPADKTIGGGSMSIPIVYKVSGTVCEIIGKFINKNNIKYKIRYVKKPTPILLEDFSQENLSIDGHSGKPGVDAAADTDGGISCKLPEGVHHEIVQRAVELCTAIYNPQALNNLVSIGNASATDLGILPRSNSKED